MISFMLRLRVGTLLLNSLNSAAAASHFLILCPLICQPEKFEGKEKYYCEKNELQEGGPNNSRRVLKKIINCCTKHATINPTMQTEDNSMLAQNCGSIRYMVRTGIFWVLWNQPILETPTQKDDQCHQWYPKFFESRIF